MVAPYYGINTIHGAGFLIPMQHTECSDKALVSRLQDYPVVWLLVGHTSVIQKLRDIQIQPNTVQSQKHARTSPVVTS